jgi:micrococcal nuclease
LRVPALVSPALRKSSPWLVAFSLLMAVALPCACATFEAVGIKALDGDSILTRFTSGLDVEVRLLNVDAPEHGQALSEEARAFTQSRIVRQPLTLVTEVDQRDRYNRLLAFVHTGGRCVNLDLVEAGLALAFLIPPNIGRADDFLAAQERAHAAGRGIWGAQGPKEEPRSFRARNRRDSKTPPRPLRYENWLIVGNTKSSVAHWPGCGHVEDIAPAIRVRFTSAKQAASKGYHMEKGYK